MRNLATPSTTRCGSPPAGHDAQAGARIGMGAGHPFQLPADAISDRHPLPDAGGRKSGTIRAMLCGFALAGLAYAGAQSLAAHDWLAAVPMLALLGAGLLIIVGDGE